MYSYLDVDRSSIQIGLIQQIIKYTNVNILTPIWSAVKLKLAVFTVPVYVWTCSLTSDPC